MPVLHRALSKAGTASPMSFDRHGTRQTKAVDRVGLAGRGGHQASRAIGIEDQQRGADGAISRHVRNRIVEIDHVMTIAAAHEALDTGITHQRHAHCDDDREGLGLSSRYTENSSSHVQARLMRPCMRV